MAWKPKSPIGKSDGKPAKPIKPVRARTFGSRQLQRETGFSQAYISRMLGKGVSPAEIKQKAIDRKSGGKTGTKTGVRANLVPTRRSTAVPVTPTPPAGYNPTGRKPTTVGGEDFRSAQTRKEIALADQREMENAIRRGELGNVQQMQNWYASGIIAAKDIALKVEELGDRIASETDPAKCRAMIRLEMERMLAELEQAFRMAAETSVEPELRKAGGTDVGSSEDGSGDDKDEAA